jgi:hypothetical protein
VSPRLHDGQRALCPSCFVCRLAGPEDPGEQLGCPRQSEQDAKSSDIEQEHQRRYRERAQKRHEKTYRPGIIHRTSNPTTRALPDGRMVLPGRQDGEVVDEPLNFAFTALGRKEKSRRWSGGRTRGGGWFWDRRHRSRFLNLKRINKSNRLHHNVPQCSWSALSTMN